MSNYAPRLARDKDGNPMQEFNLPTSVLATYARDNVTASSVISVTHDTTALEVAAVGGAAVMRWVRTADTEASVVSAADLTENFAHVIPTNTVRRFVIPIESIPTSGASFSASMVGVNRKEGLYQRVALKTVGVASVLVTEFGF